MYSKRFLAEQALRILQGGDISNDSSITYGDLTAYIAQVVNELIRVDVLGGKVEGNTPFFGDFISVYDCIDVKKDVKSCRYYAELPARPLGIPNNSAITEVSFMNDPFKTFIPVGSGFNSMAYGLDIFDLEGDISFYLEGKNRIYLNGISKEMDDALQVKMVADARSKDDKEFLPIAPEFEATIIARTIDMYKIQKGTEEDRINDGVDPVVR